MVQSGPVSWLSIRLISCFYRVHFVCVAFLRLVRPLSRSHSKKHAAWWWASFGCFVCGVLLVFLLLHLSLFFSCLFMHSFLSLPFFISVHSAYYALFCIISSFFSILFLSTYWFDTRRGVSGLSRQVTVSQKVFFLFSFTKLHEHRNEFVSFY